MRVSLASPKARPTPFTATCFTAIHSNQTDGLWATFEDQNRISWPHSCPLAKSANMPQPNNVHVELIISCLVPPDAPLGMKTSDEDLRQ